MKLLLVRRAERVNYWIIILLGLLLLGLMVPGSMALAAPDVSRLVPKSFTGYITSSDLSIRMLRSVFGNVGSNVSLLNLGASTVFGVVFKGISLGALFIEAFIIAVMTSHLITESNIDSRGVDASKNIWSSLRVVLSVTLLFPLKTGYSIIHNLILMVVIQGVGLANMLWFNATDYLFKQANNFYVPIISNAENSSTNVSQALSVPDSYLIAKEFKPSVVGFLADVSRGTSNFGSTDMARSMLCSHAVLRNLDDIRKTNINILENYKDDSSESSSGSSSVSVVNANSDVSACLDTLRNSTATDVNTMSNLFQEIENTENQQNSSGNSAATVKSRVVSFPGNISSSVSNMKSCVKTLKGSIPALKTFPEVDSYAGLCGDVNYLTSVGEDSDGSLSTAMEDVKKNTITGSILPNLSILVTSILDSYIKDNKAFTENLKTFIESTYNSSSGSNTPCYDTQQKNCSHTVVSAGAVKNVNTAIGDIDAPVTLMQNGYTYQSAVYGRLFQQLLEQEAKKTDTSKMEALYEEINSQGWMFIGNYYYKIARALINRNNLNTANQNSVFVTSTYGSDINTFYSLYSTSSKDLASALKGASNDYYSALRNGILLINAAAPVASEMESTTIPSVNTNENNEISAAIKKGLGKPASFWDKAGTLMGAALDPTKISAISGGQRVILGIAAEHLRNIINGWADNLTKDEDPVTKLIMLGNKMLEEISALLTDFYDFVIQFLGFAMILPTAGFAISSGTSWAGSFGIGLGLALFGQAMTQIGTASTQIGMQFFSMFLPLVFGVCVPLFGCGIILTVYIPLVPTLLFLFGGLSWLISLFVLLVAAPIICFLMLLGGPSQVMPLLAQDGERFIHQLIGAFFRPVLMVAGFLAGMMLCYVGFDLLHLAISNTYEFIFGDMSPVAYNWNVLNNMKTIRYIITSLAFIMVYTYAAISIVNLGFSMINLLYSETMRLVGMAAPAVGLEERSVESTKAGAQQMGDSGGQSISGMGQTGGRIADAGIQQGQGLKQRGYDTSVQKGKERQQQQKNATGSTVQSANGANGANGGGTEIQGAGGGGVPPAG